MPPPIERPPEPSDREGALREMQQGLHQLQKGIEQTTLNRESLYSLGEEKLRALFVHGIREDLKTKSETISGQIAFYNKNFELWIGLKHILPAEYKFVLVTKPNGEQVRGERQPDRSFYENGNYIAIWDGYSFEAYKNKPADWPAQTETETPGAQPPATPRSTETAAAASPSEPAPQPAEHRETSGALLETPIRQTAFFGDSLTVGMQATHSLDGSLVRAKGGRQTAAILTEFRRFIDERRAGQHREIQKVVVLGGVNDIASEKTLASITKNLAEIYRLARANGLTVVATTLHKWDTAAFLKRFEARWRRPHKYTTAELTEMTARLNAWIRQAAQVDQIADVETEFDDAQKAGQRMLGSDGLHPTGRGARTMASTIKRAGRITD